jgi:choline-glycine betaine transporter
MNETVKVLQEIGFSPLNIVLVLAVIALWKLLISRDKKQTNDREAWHAETRAQVEKLEAHTKACDEDRAKLKGQVELLSQSCQMKDCPRRVH